jgi:arylsulfatase A-like enzyme
MQRREFLGAAAALAGFAIGAEAKPNIVVILADDLGTGDVSCYNPEGKTRTPNLDNLANEGVRFTDAHSPSSVCTPTRYGVLTGQYCWRTRLKNGVLNGYSKNLIEPGRPTIASMLKAAGYQTGAFGKWHLGMGTSEPADYAKTLTPSPLDHGFDEYFGIPASLDMPPYVFVDGRQAVEAPTGTIAGNHENKGPRGPFWRGGPRSPSFEMEDVIPKITERAVYFIENARKNSPYFTYVPLPAPHTPWVPSKPYQGRSKIGLYGDFVEECDASVGKILAAIEKRGDTKNTLVIVTSDNGAPWSEPDINASQGHRANMYWRGQKADIYEAGHRVPFLVRFPARVQAKQVSKATVCLTDIFATVAEATGQGLPQNGAEDSFSIWPALRGRNAQQAVRPHIVHHSADGIFSIREGKWKMANALGSGGFTLPKRIEAAAGAAPGTLFDLEKDPFEKEDLYQKRPAEVARLGALLARVQTEGRSRN